MSKHGRIEPLKSFFRTHIDTEKDEELRRTKAEIENKVEKILNLVKEEDNDEKETLITLVKDFNNHYASLYESYDQLTEELRKIAHSSSSSSDSSDSDNSPTKKGKKNGKVEKQFDSTTAGSKHGLEVALLEVDELKRELTVTTVAEKEALSIEYQNALNKAKEAEASMMDLSAELEAVKMENLTLKEKLELAEDDISKLNQLYSTIDEEKDNQIYALLEKLEHQENQIPDLSSWKNETDLILERRNGEISELLVQIQNLKEELSSKSNEMETWMETKKNLHRDLQIIRHEKSDLETTITDLQTKLQNCEEKLKSSEEMEKMSEQFQKDSDLKNQEIYNLKEKIEDLSQELEMKVDEISTLRENMRITEVKHRLTAQKLHITEQLLNETEESQMGKVMKLLEDKRELEERISAMSNIISTYKRNQIKMIAVIKMNINEMVTGIDQLGMKFEEDYGHLESRVFYIINELQGIKTRITDSNVEKGQLKRVITCLKQEELTLKEKIGELEKELEMGEIERISLQEIVKERDENLSYLERIIKEQDASIREMERKMDEKVDRFLSLSEEKREAIRQLCVWNDYQQKRYEDLKDMISKSRGSK